MLGGRASHPSARGIFPKLGEIAPFYTILLELLQGKGERMKMIYAIAGLSCLGILCVFAMMVDASARRELARRIDQDLARRQEPRWEDEDWR